MAKISMVYLSNTGNTEAMANMLEGFIKEAGGEVNVTKASDASAEKLVEADTIVMGCPACGSEELDETYMQPLMEELDGKLSGKKVALFGSYGWGGGAYLEDWKASVEDAGGDIIGSVTVNEAPDEGEEELKELASKIAG